MYPSFQNKRYVIKVIIMYVFERKITAPKLSAKLNIFSLLSHNCESFERLLQENP